MKRILIVEDDGAIAAIERDYLMLSDFQVDIAATGPEGRAMAWGMVFLTGEQKALPQVDRYPNTDLERIFPEKYAEKAFLRKNISAPLRLHPPKPSPWGEAVTEGDG